LVMHDGAHILPVQHVCELRRREAVVEEKDVRTQLSQRDRRLDEPAVVATENPDAVALDDAGGCKTIGEGVAARLDIRKGDAPCLVDNCRVSGMQRCSSRIATRSAETPLAQCQGGGDYAIRPRRAQHSRTGEDLERTQLLQPECDRVDARVTPSSTLLAPFAQRRECAPEVAAHLSGRDSIDDKPGEAARRLIRDAQRDGGDPRVDLANAPPAALCNACDPGPCDVTSWRVLDDLHLAADLHRADPDAHRVTRAEVAAVAGAQRAPSRHAVDELRVVSGVADRVPHRAGPAANSDCLLDAHGSAQHGEATLGGKRGEPLLHASDDVRVHLVDIRTGAEFLAQVDGWQDVNGDLGGERDVREHVADVESPWDRQRYGEDLEPENAVQLEHAGEPLAAAEEESCLLPAYGDHGDDRHAGAQREPDESLAASEVHCAGFPRGTMRLVVAAR